VNAPLPLVGGFPLRGQPLVERPKNRVLGHLPICLSCAWASGTPANSFRICCWISPFIWTQSNFLPIFTRRQRKKKTRDQKAIELGSQPRSFASGGPLCGEFAWLNFPNEDGGRADCRPPPWGRWS
jgi:hypothetical protein